MKKKWKKKEEKWKWQREWKEKREGKKREMKKIKRMKGKREIVRVRNFLSLHPCLSRFKKRVNCWILKRKEESIFLWNLKKKRIFVWTVGGKHCRLHLTLTTPGRGKRTKWTGEKERKEQREWVEGAEIPRERKKQSLERRGETGSGYVTRVLWKLFFLLLHFLYIYIYWFFGGVRIIFCCLVKE